MIEMKKIKIVASLFCFAILAIAFSGCSDDDDDESPNLSLTGTLWTEVSFSSTNCTDPDDNETETVSCTATDCFTIVFNANGTFLATDIEDGDVEVDEGTYSISGNTVTVNIGGGQIPSTFSITLDRLTFTTQNPFDGCTTVGVFVGTTL